MKIHSTNYFNVFIEVSEDCAASAGIAPPAKKDKPTVAQLQYDMIVGDPYRFTSDEIIFSVFASRNDLAANEWEGQRKKFFSQGQACFRASPLAKNYGWGIHYSEEGKVALFGVGTEQYRRLTSRFIVEKAQSHAY